MFLSALFPVSHKKVYFLELDFKTITIFCSIIKTDQGPPTFKPSPVQNTVLYSSLDTRPENRTLSVWGKNSKEREGFRARPKACSQASETQPV